MNREKILQQARWVGLEEMARKLLDDGYGESYVVDRLFEEAGRGRSRKAIFLDAVDDDTLTRALSEPILTDL